MGERVLVTGANGFIGSYLVAELEAAGYEVIRHGRETGDIARCPLPFRRVRHVIHLAGNTYVPDSWRSPRDFYDVNVIGTANVLEFCRETGAAVTIMSSYVYGAPDRLPISEDHPLRPFNPYSHSKILAEQVSRYFEAEFGVCVSILRPFNIYGPGQDSRFLIPSLVQQFLGPETTISVADLRPKRDYLYIRDLVRLMRVLVAQRVTGVYNAGSGASVSIKELVETLERLTGNHKSLVCRNEYRPKEILDMTADISKAARELGWAPQVTLENGLREVVSEAGQKRICPS